MRPRPLITSLMRTFVSIVMTIIEVLLFLRLVFMLFGANASNGIVRWVYSVSNAFVAPFNGIFDDVVINGQYVLEIDAMIAWFFYLVVYVLILEFIKLIERALVS